ncbi:MAG: molybdenum cofactor biosynthesis protein [Chlorobi bacterium]|nr:molybdenum cofactor biosynthesis protein [Chlorobiota bacterium]
MNTLIDRHGRKHTYLRISVTDRCNLRCAYCMPEEEMIWKRREEILSFEEIIRIAGVAVSMGVEKIRVTGGEPLVRSDIEDLLARLRAIPGLRSLALTTNAVLLKRKLPAIRASVDTINISLDTFSPERFRELTRRDALADVLEGIDAAIDAGFASIKLNAVILRGLNDDELLDFVNYAADRPIAVRFIEFMPFAGNAWNERHCVTMGEMLGRIEERFLLERIPDGPSPISRDYHVTDRQSGRRHAGTVGVIASMSQPFCDSCSRLRLTAEGKVMPCLHSPLEFDLRSILRSGGDDAAVAGLFLRALDAKPKEHPSAGELLEQSGRVMIQIGG